jgi:hypothetical protein
MNKLVIALSLFFSSLCTPTLFAGTPQQNNEQICSILGKMGVNTAELREKNVTQQQVLSSANQLVQERIAKRKNESDIALDRRIHAVDNKVTSYIYTGKIPSFKAKQAIYSWCMEQKLYEEVTGK